MSFELVLYSNGIFQFSYRIQLKAHQSDRHYIQVVYVATTSAEKVMRVMRDLHTATTLESDFSHHKHAIS